MRALGQLVSFLRLGRYADEIGIKIQPFKMLVYLPSTDKYVPCTLIGCFVARTTPELTRVVCQTTRCPRVLM